MADLQLAIAGAGFWAAYQVAAWKELPGVQCKSICDTDRAKAARLADRFGIPQVYTDAATMLDEIQTYSSSLRAAPFDASLRWGRSDCVESLVSRIRAARRSGLT